MIAEENVLVGPGYIFAAEDGIQKETEGHFRIAFSHAEVCLFIILGSHCSV